MLYRPQLNTKILECAEQLQDFESALEAIDKKDQEIQNTKSNNRQLSSQIADLNQKLIQLKYPEDSGVGNTFKSLESSDLESLDEMQLLIRFILQRSENNDAKASLTTALAKAFSRLTFLRNSIDEVLSIYHRDIEKFAALMETLLYLDKGCIRQLRNYKKINAVNRRWKECRVPHIDMLRLYFHKSKPDKRYYVLISSKKDEKTQSQDFEWLKQYPIS